MRVCLGQAVTPTAEGREHGVDSSTQARQSWGSALRTVDEWREGAGGRRCVVYQEAPNRKKNRTPDMDAAALVARGPPARRGRREAKEQTLAHACGRLTSR